MAEARRVEPEWLDQLPAADPRAVRSRRDLARINVFMANARIVARELRTRFPKGVTALLELGAGDGTFALAVVERLPRPTASATVTLLDRAPCVPGDLAARFAARGWTMRILEADVFDGLDRFHEPVPAIIANLFLHHFDDARLAALLAHVARRSRVFVACEPRRSRTALAGSHLLGLIGCNDVTRHDAVVSVRAGFRGGEIGALWPRGGGPVEERGRGLFSHSFVASSGAIA